MTTGTDRLGLLLHDAARAMRKRFERRMGARGLSSAQWRLIANLAREGQSRQARLADLLEIEPISVSRLLDRMEQGGWIRRQSDPDDRRARLIVPTDKTLAAYAEIKAGADELYAEALHGLTPEQSATLIAGLRTIIANLSADDAPTAACRDHEAET